VASGNDSKERIREGPAESTKSTVNQGKGVKRKAGQGKTREKMNRIKNAVGHQPGTGKRKYRMDPKPADAEAAKTKKKTPPPHYIQSLMPRIPRVLDGVKKEKEVWKRGEEAGLVACRETKTYWDQKGRTQPQAKGSIENSPNEGRRSRRPCRKGL